MFKTHLNRSNFNFKNKAYSYKANSLKLLLCVFFAIVVSFKTLSIVVSDTATVKIENGHLNIRQEPNEYSDVVGKLQDGAEIDVDRSRGLSFSALLSGDNIIGWVANRYLDFGEMPIMDKLTELHTYRVLTDWETTSDFKGEVEIVGFVKQGDIVKGTDTTPTHIHLHGGGFIPKSAVEEIKE